MAFGVTTRMCIGYNNRINSADVSSVGVTNITPDSGFPASNLGFEDPAMFLKTSATSANDRIITFTLGTSVTAACFGIANHDIMSQGYHFVRVEYFNGSVFVSLGGDLTISGRLGNPNFLLRFNSVAATTWRLTIGMTSGTRPAFQIGHCFLGSVFVPSTNPGEGQVYYEQATQMEPLVSVGGARFYRQGPQPKIERFEVSIPRLSSADNNVLSEGIYRSNSKRIIAVIPPESADVELPVGTQHIFGRMESLVSQAVSGYAGSSSHRYNVTVSMSGMGGAG